MLNYLIVQNNGTNIGYVRISIQEKWNFREQFETGFHVVRVYKSKLLYGL